MKIGIIKINGSKMIEKQVFFNQNMKISSSGNFLFDIDDPGYLDLYFALKEKNNRFISLEDKKLFETYVAGIIEQRYSSFGTLVIIESSKSLLKNIASLTSFKNKVILRKNSKENIVSNIHSLGFNKDELKSQFRRINKMDDSFNIHKIKSNQRHRYENILFEKLSCTGKVLLFDDSMFTGSTIKAALSSIDHVDQVLTIFGTKTL